MQVSLLARHTGQDQETIAKDIQRPKYFDPYQAKEYGIIDRVRMSDSFAIIVFLDGILAVHSRCEDVGKGYEVRI